jgi:hypothetical protein
MRSVSTAIVTSAALALGALGAPPIARADADYAPDSEAWNGLAQFVQTARDIGVAVELPARVDLGTLQATDALVIVYPTSPPSVDGLGGFLKAGGRVALLDDFGRGDALLAAYQIARHAPDSTTSPRLRGNPALLVATPASPHPLTEGVTSLVTNHPAVVAHRELEPIFVLGGREALVLAGAVGQGRLVTVADGSVLINNMQQFAGNRRFAQNLVRYLVEARLGGGAAAGGDVAGDGVPGDGTAGDDAGRGGAAGQGAAGQGADGSVALRGGRLVIATPGVPVVGRFGEPGADRPLHDLRVAIERLADARLPAPAVWLAAAVLASILLLFAATSLPRRSPYDGRGMFARAPHAGGFVGRVGYYATGEASFLPPTLAYRFELEAELVRRLGLGPGALLGDVAGALRARGVPEREVEAARALLVELEALHARLDAPPGPPRVTGARVADMVRRGEALLARLPERPTRP